MAKTAGRVARVQILEEGRVLSGIACPRQLQPAPGQYLMAYRRLDESAPGGPGAELAIPLVPAGLPQAVAETNPSSGEMLFWTLAPADWIPGTELRLRGPLGRGFSAPLDARRAVLAALTGHVERLLPLVGLLLHAECAVTMYSDGPVPGNLPASVELYPLRGLSEALNWADFLALDLRVEQLPSLREALDLPAWGRLACPAQAFLEALMPCGALAECAVCAVRSQRGWKLTCAEGPVFNLDELDW